MKSLKTRELKTLVINAQAPNEWNLLNQMLYDLCKRYPTHESTSEIIAKVNVIGRVYAAAIERRREKEDATDDFYIGKVAPAIQNSKIDQWLSELKAVKRLDANSIPKVILTHGRLTELFYQISGLEKRSLASKYLHFHHPRLFFIYDSRAAKGLSRYSNIVGRSKIEAPNDGDEIYSKYFSKCMVLRNFIKEAYGKELSPREIDNLLLETEKKI